MKWYKFYNNNLLVVLGSKQGGTLKLVNPNTRLSVNSIADSLIPNFPCLLAEMSSYFQSKQTKEKLGNALCA